MDTDSDDWDPVQELRKSQKRHSSVEIPSSFSKLKQNRLTLPKGPLNNLSPSGQSTLLNASNRMPSASGNTTSHKRLTTSKTQIRSRGESEVSSDDNEHHASVSDSTRFLLNEKGRPSSASSISSTIVPTSSSKSSAESIHSAVTIVKPLNASKNTARKSFNPQNSTIDKQLAELEKRGLVTPTSKNSPSKNPVIRINGINVSSPAHDNTPDSFTSQREKAKVSLINRIENSISEASSQNVPIPGFVVDSFSKEHKNVIAFFLTRFQFECVSSLGRWLEKPLYCSPITAKLLGLLANQVDPDLFRPMRLKEFYTINQVQVMALDSNYSPGSVMFLFKLPNDKLIVHTGALRFSQTADQWPELLSAPISHLFLDTTYCYKGWNFPEEEEVFNYVRDLVHKKLQIFRTKILFVVASETVGSEKLILLIAEELNAKIWAPPLKQAVLRSIGNKELVNLFTSNPLKAQVHLISKADTKTRNLTEYLSELDSAFTHMLVFHSSGWNLEDGVRRRGNLKNIQIRTFGHIQICPLPYSRHCGYDELRDFVKSVRPEKISPLLYGSSEKQKSRMRQIFATWTR